MIRRVVLFSNPVYLSVCNNQLVARTPDENKPLTTIPVEDIGVIVLDNRQITITLGLLDLLLQNNVAVVSCDSKHMPVGLQLPLDGNTLQSERFKYQIEASLPLKKQLWQQTIQTKILNQRAVLNKIAKIETGNMEAWSRQVRSGDPDNLEARAAVYYWRNIFASDVRDFIRDPDGEMPNALLNYGYAIVRAMMARALVSAGLLPTLGIHHHNRYNAYCLADDIMEPYRPYVDVAVIEIMKDYKKCDDEEFILDKDVKRRLLSLPVTDAIIDGKKRPMINAIEVTDTSLMQCYQGKRRKILYPFIQDTNSD